MRSFTKPFFFYSLIFLLIAGGGLLAQPTVNTPTISAVTTTSATLGGKIAVGTSITGYGTAYKTTAGVAATDNPQNGGAVPDGSIPYTFTQNRIVFTAGTQYFWVAWATGTGGTGLSAEQSFFTEPNQPATFSITAASTTNNQIVLSFPAASSLVGAAPATGGYVLFRHAGSAATVSVTDGSAPPANGTGDKIATITSIATSYTDGSLSAQTQYYYTLVPFVWDGSTATTYNYNTTSPLSTNGFTLSNPPSGQPTSLTSVGGSNTQINLTLNWGAVTANGFLVYQNTTGTPVIAGGDFTNGTTPPASLADGSTQITSVSSLATSYNNTGLTAATQYYYIVVPFGYDGSNSATYNYNTTSPKTTTAYTLSNPASGQPTPLNATGTSPSQINLTWSSVTATGFLIYRLPGGTAPNVSAILNGAAPPASLADGSTLITTAAGGVTAYNNTGLPPATQYSYTIVPFTYDGSHAGTYNYLLPSAPTANAYTYSSSPSGQPASFSATAAGYNQINLSWSSGVTSIAGFLIYRLPGNTSVSLTGLNSGSAPPSPLGDGSTLIATVGSGAISYSDNSGLSGGTKYQYKLVPFGYDGSHAQTYNFLTAGAKASNATTFSNNSTITYVSSTSPVSIAYIDYSAVGAPIDNTNSVRLGQFNVNDLGGDGQPTTLSSVTISIANNANVAEIAIFDSGQNNVGQVTNPGSSATFNGLSTISAADGSFDYFEIWATFQNTVTDQQKIKIDITGVTVAVPSSGISSFSVSTPISANKIQVTATQLAMTTGSTNVNVSANFGPVTVSAVDAFGNVQISRTDSVKLKLSPATTLSLIPLSTYNEQQMTNGTVTWSSAKINLAGTYTLQAKKSPTVPNPLTPAGTSITVHSAGVTVTPGTLANSPLCSNGDYQNISAITITESDPSDFAVGTNVSFSIILPSGFLFNSAASPSFVTAGNPGPASDFTGSPGYTYSADKTTVTFTYTVGSVVNKDKITISGLQVNYTGSTFPFSGNMVRLGGTAVQQGNATTDGKIYCVMSAAQSATVVDFNVQTVPGQATVTPGQTRFQVGITSVQLLGNPSGGSFSGPGVSPNATYGYIFSPSSVGVSTGNQIVYTYKETTGQHCNVTTTKSFDVYASVIQNLQLSYCTNATPSTGLTVVQADVDNQFPPANSYSKYDLVYYAGNSCSGLGCTYAYSSTYIGYTTIYSTYTSSYNLLGTTTLAQTQSYTNTYNWNGSYYAYAGYTYSSNKIANAGSVTTFDPSQSYYRSAYSSGVIVYYRAIDNATSTIVTVGGGQFVPLVDPPAVSFSLPKLNFCANEASVNLVGNPLQNSAVTDKFSSTGGGIPPNVGNTWTFTPSLVTQLGTPFNIRYDYTDPYSGCSNYAIQSVTVFSLPSQVQSTELNGTGSPPTLITCVGNPAVTFTANAPSTKYNWYNSSIINPANFIQSGNNFTPTTSTATAGSTDYFVTKVLYSSPTFAGCESTTATNVRMTVQAGPTLTLSTSAEQICFGSNVDIKQSTIGAVLTNATTATWSTVGAGQFLDGSGNPSTTLGSSGTSTTLYKPLGTDLPVSPGINPTTVILKLTTDNLSAPSCLPATQNFTVTIYPAPVAPQFTIPSQAAIPSGLFEFCDSDISNHSQLQVTGSGTGTITYYSDAALTNVLDSGGDPRTYSYGFNPGVSRLVPIYATQTINGCKSTPTSLTFRLDPLPQPAFSVNQFCQGMPTQFSDTTHVPTGATTYALSSWDWDFNEIVNGIKGIGVGKNISYKYNSIGIFLPTVTITSNAIDTGYPCTATSSPKTIEIGPVPQTDFTVTNQCFNDNTVFNYSSGTLFDKSTAGKTLATWSWVFDTANPGTTSVTQTSPIPPGIPVIPAVPTFQYGSPGLYNAQLTLTSGLGCQNSITKSVYVLPLIKFNTSNLFSYNESFEDNTNTPTNNQSANYGAWATELFSVGTNPATSTSWNLLSPNGPIINSASNGTKAWVAGLLPTANNGLTNTYNSNETSVLNSPCFDISTLTKPIISFDYLADLWNRNDGVYVQSSVDGGVSWQTFGQRSKGISWYNDGNIVGLSGSGNLGQPVGQIGWDDPNSGNGQSNPWSKAYYTLSNLSTAQPIRFRFYLGTQGNIDQTTVTGSTYVRPPYNGYGLDNVTIQNSNRTILAEYFTNQTASAKESTPHASDNNFQNFEPNATKQSLVKIQYHTPFGGADDIFSQNQQDNSARAAFYGITGTSSFKGFIDGWSDPSGFNGNIAPSVSPPPLTNSENYYERELLIPSPVTLSLSTGRSTNNDSLTVDVNVTVGAQALATAGHQYVVQLAIVQDMSGTGVGPFNMKKLLPNASGRALTISAINSSQTLHYAFTTTAADSSNIYASSFVQDIITQPTGSLNVLQAATQRISTSSLIVITDVKSILDNARVYPNPSDQEFTIVLPVGASQPLQVSLINQLGQVAQATSFGEGEQTKTVSTHGLSDGVYILQVGGGTAGVRTKVIVLHK